MLLKINIFFEIVKIFNLQNFNHLQKYGKYLLHLSITLILIAYMLLSIQLFSFL